MATVMVVPGICGNDLYTGRALLTWFQRAKIWLSYARLAAGAWRWLGLDSQAVNSSFPGVGQLEPGGPVLAYYGQLIDRMSQAGHSVISAVIDWRGTLESDARRLADQVEAHADFRPINFIAHSRGGLVVRAALQVLAQRRRLDLVGKVAGLGVPHFGSWQAAALLSSFQSVSRLVTHLLLLVPGSAVADLFFGGWRSVVRSWPSAYELLPNPAGTFVPPDQINRVYDPREWARINANVSEGWLAAARANWGVLPLPPAGVPWLDVVGVGFLTPIRLTGPILPTSNHGLEYTADGDGDVAAESAVLPGNPRITVNVPHIALITDGRIAATLNAWLRGQLPQQVAAGGMVFA